MTGGEITGNEIPTGQEPIIESGITEGTIESSSEGIVEGLPSGEEGTAPPTEATPAEPLVIDYGTQTQDVSPVFVNTEDPGPFSFDNYESHPEIAETYTPEPVKPAFFDDSGNEVKPNDFVESFVPPSVVVSNIVTDASTAGAIDPANVSVNEVKDLVSNVSE